MHTRGGGTLVKLCKKELSVRHNIHKSPVGWEAHTSVHTRGGGTLVKLCKKELLSERYNIHTGFVGWEAHTPLCIQGEETHCSNSAKKIVE